MQQRGQSTIELALVLPVLAALLFLVIKGFGVHSGETEKSIEKQRELLRLFDHGRNRGTLLVDGDEIRPGTYSENFETDWWDIGLSAVPVDSFIDSILSKSALFSGTNVVSGYARGYTKSVSRDLVKNRFDINKVNWDGAQRAGLVGSLSSTQVTDFFQGTAASASGTRELVGSAAQGALVAFGESKFEKPTAMLGGLAGGVVSSDTAGAWIGNGHQDILKGAGVGAVSSAIAGAQSGKIDFKNVGIGGALGGFNTTSVANYFPWQEGVKDARQASSFLAANSALATLLQGGSTEDAFYASTESAFFGSQIQSKVVGNGSKTSKWTRSTASSTAFVAAESKARGGNSATVGAAAMQSAISGTMPAAAYVANKGMRKVLAPATHVPGVKQALRTASAVPQAAADAANYVVTLRFLRKESP